MSISSPSSPSLSKQLRQKHVLSPKSAKTLQHFDPAGTVFAEFTGLANEHKAVNLGQGFPTLPLPSFIPNALASAAQSSNSLLQQYTRSEGHVRLVNALAKYYQPQLNREINPMTEILTTVGATEAIYASIQAFVNPGDEVILMQPFYDSYPASVLMSGGTPKFVSLLPPKTSNTSSETKASDWKLDMTELKASITPKTKMLIVNNPHNPLGKVFSKSELQEIADIAIKNDLIVIADEVYETLVYNNDGATTFQKLASLPGMWERTLSIGSIGKTFGVTGWKIGWITAPAPLIRSIWTVHQWNVFCVPTPLQEAAAICFEQSFLNPQSIYHKVTLKEYQRLRDVLVNMLKESGFDPIIPQGGYFVCADTSSLDSMGVNTIIPGLNDHETRRDFQVCKYLIKEAGVCAIPPSAFYSKGSNTEISGKLARFAFCKTEEMIADAGKRLKAWKQRTSS